MLRLLQLASKLASPPDAHAGWSPTAVARLPSPLQLAVHHLLEALPPFPTAVSASNLWPLLLWQLLKFIEPTLPVERAPSPPGEKPRDAVCFAERAHALLLRLFTEQAQPSAKLVVFEDVMQARAIESIAIVDDTGAPGRGRIGCPAAPHPPPPTP